MSSETKILTAVGSMIVIAMAASYLGQMFARVEPVTPEAYGAFWFLPAGRIMNVDLSSEANPTYVGEAQPGTLDSEAKWRIYRYEYVVIDGDEEPARIRFASGNTNFDKIWDSRVEYEYS